MMLRAFFYLGWISIVYSYTCDKTNTVCETTLIISEELTMNHPMQKFVYPYKGKLYRYDVTNTSTATPIPPEQIIVADGYEVPRLVTVANKQLPGPDIIVYEGQQLKVHVVNRLHTDAVTIHWHGLTMRGTPWMDGTAYITQCPILPGQTFTYEFVAEPKGTHYYHSHIGAQRSDGLFGSLIVREKLSSMEEHIIQLNDWNHAWRSDEDLLRHTRQIENRKIWSGSWSIDGTIYTSLFIHSVLINGKGRYYNKKTGKHNDPPLTTFNVTFGNMYRFRIINAGNIYPYELSIDNHRFDIVASDGYDLKSITVDVLIINPGERFDIIVHANQSVGNYWVRAKTLQSNENNRAEAILRYDGATLENPSTSKRNCSQKKRCLHVNCPFTVYPDHYYTDCVNMDRFKSENDPVPQVSNSNELKEIFLNFAFPEFIPSVNSKIFERSTVSALTQPLEIENTCDKAQCGENKVCHCHHTIDIKHGEIVQMTLLNSLSDKLPFPSVVHSIHLHGYSFHVLRMVFPSQNSSTGNTIGPTGDIDCRSAYCSDATWTDSSWLGGNLPGLDMQEAPRKDTVIVPVGGYVVIRIKADNPGVWALHCHFSIHIVSGMSVLLNNSYGQHPDPPIGFPICHNFPSGFRSKVTVPPTTTTAATTVGATSMLTADDPYTAELFWIVVAILSAVIVICCGIIGFMYVQRKDSKYAISGS